MANRKHQIERFEAMLSKTTTERILFLEAHSAYGKTFLLSKFDQISKNRFGAGCCALIDLRVEYQLEELMMTLTRMLDAESFQNFERMISARRRRSSIIRVDATDSDVGDKNTINIGNHFSDETVERLHEMSSAFLSDLERRNEMTILIFDSFEKELPELKKWIIGQVLPAVRRNQNLVVVIAGQRTIGSDDHHATWRDFAHYEYLEPVRSPEDWHTYARVEHPELSPEFPCDEFLQELCELLFEMPSAIVMCIQNRAQKLYRIQNGIRF